MTALATAFFCGMTVYFVRRADSWCWIALVSVLAVWLVATLFYAPLWVEVTDTALIMRRSLKSTSLPIADIASVKLCPPTMAERRISGSGGFMGYWGWFSERDLGRYFAYYGKASDCFLVTLRNGRRYMLGCENPAAVVDMLNKKIAA